MDEILSRQDGVCWGGGRDDESRVAPLIIDCLEVLFPWTLD